MPYYRIKVGNREAVIEHEGTQDEVGEIYKDRLVGECDQYGHLRNYYISPATRKALDEAAKALWSEWDVTEDGKFIRKEPTEARAMSIPLVIKPLPETPQPKYIKRYKVEYNGVPYYAYALTMEQVAQMDDLYGADKGEWLNQTQKETPMHNPMFESVFGESNLAEVVQREANELERIMQKPFNVIQVYHPDDKTKCTTLSPNVDEANKHNGNVFNRLPSTTQEFFDQLKTSFDELLDALPATPCKDDPKPKTHSHTGADVTTDPIAELVKQVPNLLHSMSSSMVLANMLGDLVELNKSQDIGNVFVRRVHAPIYEQLVASFIDGVPTPFVMENPELRDEYLSVLTKRVLSVKCSDAPTHPTIDDQMVAAHHPTIGELIEERKAIVNDLLAAALPSWEQVREKLDGALKVFPPTDALTGVSFPSADLNITLPEVVIPDEVLVPYRDRRFFRTSVFDMLIQGINGFTRRCFDKYEDKLMNSRDNGMLSPRRANLRDIAIRERIHVEGQIQRTLAGPATTGASGIRLGYQFDNVQDNVLIISFRTRKGIVPVLTVTYDDGNFHLKHHEGL